MDAKAMFTGKRNVIFFALCMYFLWGSAFPSLKLGYSLFHIDAGDFPGQLVFAGFRFTFSGLLILVFKMCTGGRSLFLQRTDVLRVILFGLFMTMLQYTFFYAGMARTSGVKGSIVTSTSTFFSVLLAPLFFKNERLCLPIIFGCLIGFAGVVLVNFKTGMDFSLTLGELFVIIAALVFAFGGIFGKVLSMTIPPDLMTGWQLTFGGLGLFFTGYLLGGHLPEFTFESSLIIAYLIFISASAFTLMALLLKYNPVGSVTIFNFSTPVFGSALSGILLGDPWLEWKNLFALLLVSIGIYLVTKTASSSGLADNKE